MRCEKDERLYKIASLYLALDRYGDPYIKIMFPSGSETRMYKTCVGGPNLWSFEHEKMQELKNGEIQELSYKLHTGDSHFKGSTEVLYPDMVKGSSTPSRDGLIQIGQIGVTGLCGYMEFKKGLRAEDIIFDSIWDGVSRSIGIFVVKSSLEVNILNADKMKYIQNHSYRVHFHRLPEYDVIITDNFFLGESNYKGIAFYRPDNPIRCHRP